jgi:hypothetical protein
VNLTVGDEAPSDVEPSMIDVESEETCRGSAGSGDEVDDWEVFERRRLRDIMVGPMEGGRCEVELA